MRKLSVDSGCYGICHDGWATTLIFEFSVDIPIIINMDIEFRVQIDFMCFKFIARISLATVHR